MIWMQTKCEHRETNVFVRSVIIVMCDAVKCTKVLHFLVRICTVKIRTYYGKNAWDLGPVVQSIVSLTSSLRGQLVKYFTTLLLNTLIFFVEKMREAFALQKLFTFFFIKNIGIFEILTFEILTSR